MRVLVIGRTGQLARALAARRPAGMTLGVLGRAQCDLAFPAGIGAAILPHRPDVVINAAAYTAVDRAEAERDLAFRVNATAVGAIAQACTVAGAALIHISTDYVFDGMKPLPYRETDRAGPLNVYGASKLAGERAAREGCARTVILRTSWLYSPWGRNFLTTMLALAASRPRIEVVADQRGTPTSALDLAEACLAVARTAADAPAGAPIWGLYHCAGAAACSWAEFAGGLLAAAHRRLGTPMPAIEPIGSADYPTAARRPCSSVLGCQKFESAFALCPPPWPEALGQVLDRIAADRTASPQAVAG